MVYKENRVSSKLEFIKSVLQSGNETELYVSGLVVYMTPINSVSLLFVMYRSLSFLLFLWIYPTTLDQPLNIILGCG